MAANDEGLSRPDLNDVVVRGAVSPGIPSARSVDDYLALATRENTRTSYASAVRHFEIEWGGLLPATPDSIARYLAEYGDRLASSTLQHRLSALSRWHHDQGFADPTKHARVRQVLRGIRVSQPVVVKQARTIKLEHLEAFDREFRIRLDTAEAGERLRLLRDHALLLLGFWRGFRSDELASLLIENVSITAGQGMVCYLGHSKTDRQALGHSFATPALSRLCPVAACQAWIAASGCDEGPLFRRIDQWGNLGQEPLHVDSIAPLLRSMLLQAGIAQTETFSTHSMRRGFANWASENGWDIKQLMDYVGWRDIKSAIRYVDVATTAARDRIEAALVARPIPATAIIVNALAGHQPVLEPQSVRLELKMSLSARGGSASKAETARRRIEQWCLKPRKLRRLDDDGLRYEVSVSFSDSEPLEDTVYQLLDDMHRIAEERQCGLEASFRDRATDRYWN